MWKSGGGGVSIVKAGFAADKGKGVFVLPAREETKKKEPKHINNK